MNKRKRIVSSTVRNNFVLSPLGRFISRTLHLLARCHALRALSQLPISRRCIKIRSPANDKPPMIINGRYTTRDTKNCGHEQTRRERSTRTGTVATRLVRGARILDRLQGRVILRHEWLSLKSSFQYRDRATRGSPAQVHTRTCACCSFPFPSSHLLLTIPLQIGAISREETIRDRLLQLVTSRTDRLRSQFH